MSHTPPFTISSTAISLIAEISALVERYAIRLEAEGLRLRKANRIKTIHSSLAIEGNQLEEEQVSALLEGRHVVAPPREIQEVRNAIRTYDLYPSLNPFREADLLRAHGVMMEGLIDSAERYRRGGVGVFGEGGIEHLAPPASRVPLLMANLFEWLRTAKDHLLIRSCVFHYEFEFIHPFDDGNGRTGRLWQSLILGRLNPVFEHLPVENMVYANQQQYYDVLALCGRKADSGPFIDFMLQEIHNALQAHKGSPLADVGTNVGEDVGTNVGEDVGISVGTNVGINVGTNEQRLMQLLRRAPRATARQMAEELNFSVRQCERLLANMKQQGLIQRVGATKNGHWEVLNDTL